MAKGNRTNHSRTKDNAKTRYRNEITKYMTEKMGFSLNDFTISFNNHKCKIYIDTPHEISPNIRAILRQDLENLPSFNEVKSDIKKTHLDICLSDNLIDQSITPDLLEKLESSVKDLNQKEDGSESTLNEKYNERLYLKKYKDKIYLKMERSKKQMPNITINYQNLEDLARMYVFFDLSGEIRNTND